MLDIFNCIQRNINFHKRKQSSSSFQLLHKHKKKEKEKRQNHFPVTVAILRSLYPSVLKLLTSSYITLVEEKRGCTSGRLPALAEQPRASQPVAVLHGNVILLRKQLKRREILPKVANTRCTLSNIRTYVIEELYL